MAALNGPYGNGANGLNGRKSAPATNGTSSAPNLGMLPTAPSCGWTQDRRGGRS